MATEPKSTALSRRRWNPDEGGVFAAGDNVDEDAVDDARERLDAFFQEAQKAVDSKAKVYEVGPRPSDPLALLFEYNVWGQSMGELEQRLLDEYTEPGTTKTFEIRGYIDSVQNRLVRLTFKKPKSAANKGSESMETFMAMMERQRQADEARAERAEREARERTDRMEREAKEAREEARRMAERADERFMRMIEMMNNKPQGDGMMGTILALKELGLVGGDKSDAKTMMETLETGMRLGQQIAGKDPDDDGTGIFGKALGALTPMLAAYANRQPAPPAQPGQPPRPPVPPQQASLPAPAPDENAELQVLLKMLDAAARRDADPETYADMLMDQLPGEMIHALVTDAASFEAVLGMIPAGSSHRAWFDSLREIMAEFLQDNAEGVPDAGGAASGGAIPDDAGDNGTGNPGPLPDSEPTIGPGGD